VIVTDQIREKLAFPLDVSTLAEAEALIETLHPHVGVFKVGLQLYVAEGPRAVAAVKRVGARCFLDLKLHDIPATVAHAVESAVALDADYLTLHASAGSEALRAAVKTCSGSELRLLAVTVLTSSGEETLNELGVQGPVQSAVSRLARLAFNAGVSGFVCSPQECEMLRAQLGGGALLVTPGVRGANDALGDQHRVATPEAAIIAGSDMLVVGRPIRDAVNPAEAAAAFLAAIQRGLAARAP
jgi:orotidine-5'-phosphate decarboxylase